MAHAFTVCHFRRIHILCTWFRTPKAYVRERFLRLLIPFLFGIITYIPLTTYIRKAGSLSFPEHYRGFFIFDFEHLDRFDGTFTPAHLWFILFLFIFSLAALPQFPGTAQRKRSGDHQSRPPALVACEPVPVGHPAGAGRILGSAWG